MGAICDSPRFVPRFEDLPKIILGKNYGVFLLRRILSNIADVQQVSSERQMRTMLFQNPERQKTSSLGLLDGRLEIRGSQFFPVHGKFCLTPSRRYEQQNKERNPTCAHVDSPDSRILAFTHPPHFRNCPGTCYSIPSRRSTYAHPGSPADSHFRRRNQTQTDRGIHWTRQYQNRRSQRRPHAQ